MKTFSLEEAKSNLDELLSIAESGEIVRIKTNDSQVFELVVGQPDLPGAPVPGLFKGKIKISDDFDEPLPEMAPYM